jgi:hypothetical protein
MERWDKEDHTDMRILWMLKLKVRPVCIQGTMRTCRRASSDASPRTQDDALARLRESPRPALRPNRPYSIPVAGITPPIPPTPRSPSTCATDFFAPAVKGWHGVARAGLFQRGKRTGARLSRLLLLRPSNFYRL